MDVNGSLRIEVNSGKDAQLCLDSTVFGLMQETATLEEKVSQLFELLRNPIYLYLLTVLGNRAEAEDVVQETFLRLCRSLHRGQVIGNVRFWLFRVAHNVAIDQRRRPQHYEPVDVQTWKDVLKLLPDPGLNPEQRVLEVERFERLHAAMARLSPQEMQCLHLRAEGFRYREIAEILGIGSKSATEFLRRSIKKLMIQNNG